MAQNLMALAILLLSVWAAMWVTRRRSSSRGKSAGAHRPVGRGGSLDFVNEGRRVLRSNRRILSPVRTTSARAHLRRIPAAATGPVAVKLPGHIASAPGGPRYV